MESKKSNITKLVTALVIVIIMLLYFTKDMINEQLIILKNPITQDTISIDTETIWLNYTVSTGKLEVGGCWSYSSSVIEHTNTQRKLFGVYLQSHKSDYSDIVTFVNRLNNGDNTVYNDIVDILSGKVK